MAAPMKSLIFVFIGGGVGAGLRYWLSVRLAPLAAAPGWPWATFIVNISGSLAMGMLAAWLMQAQPAANLGMGQAAGNEGFAANMRLLLGVGLLGGFTTFSAFSLEMAMMVDRGALLIAFGYALASVVAALAALFAGLAIGRALFA